MIFENEQNLAEIYAPPGSASDEPIANFPLQWYEQFLQLIVDLDIQTITYKDLFQDIDDWGHEAGYEKEFENWSRKTRKRKKTYLLLQHDIDNNPFFTKRIVAMEQRYGVRSNIFIFRERFSKHDKNPAYDVDRKFFQDAQEQGFVIGYHQNAFALAGFDMEKAIKRYKEDVDYLRQYYNIDFVVPHGGAGIEIDGKRLTNCDVPIPDNFKSNLRWVYNRYGVKFADRWSDGGLRKTRDLKRIEGFDLVGKFLPSLKPGTRNYCLTHPQRWGYNVDPDQNPMLAEQAWYKDVCSKYLIPNKCAKSPQAT